MNLRKENLPPPLKKKAYPEGYAFFYSLKNVPLLLSPTRPANRNPVGTTRADRPARSASPASIRRPALASKRRKPPYGKHLLVPRQQRSGTGYQFPSDHHPLRHRKENGRKTDSSAGLPLIKTIPLRRPIIIGRHTGRPAYPPKDEKTKPTNKKIAFPEYPDILL